MVKKIWKLRSRETIGEKIFGIVNAIILIFCGIVTLFPFINIIATSFSSSRAIISNEVMLLPVEFTTEVYKRLIEDGQLLRGLKNTVLITCVGTLLNMLVTIFTAYALSKKRLKGRKPLMTFFVFTMIFSGGLIPTFIVIKNTGLVDTYWALWIPAIISVYNMTIMKNFFESVPSSLEEAAQIDGASDWYIMLRIYIPLSKAIVATLALFYAVYWWNNYSNVLYYITTTTKQTMTVVLMQMLDSVDESLMSGDSAIMEKSLTPEGVKAAAIICTVLPIMCVYPFVQRYFVKGVMIGSVKG